MAHTFHQFAQVGTGLSGQVIAGVAQVVKVRAGYPGSQSGLDPDTTAEVPAAQGHARWAGEDERVIIGRGEVGKVPGQVASDRGGKGNDAATGSGLEWSKAETAARQLVQ